MTVDEIRSNIRYNENLIDQLNGEKRGYENQIAELEAMRGKFNTLQNKFGEQQESRKSRLSFLQNSNIQNQIAGRFFGGMSALLNGLDFWNAYNGLDDARTVINRKINALDDLLDSCEQKIRYRHDRRNYWIGQLNAALAAQEDA